MEVQESSALSKKITSDETRRKSLKLCQERFRLDIRKISSLKWLSSNGTRLLRDVFESPPLKVLFKRQEHGLVEDLVRLRF